MFFANEMIGIWGPLDVFSMGLVSRKTTAGFSGLELLAPLPPLGRGEVMEITLIANGQQFHQSFLYHKTSIKNLKILGVGEHIKELRSEGCVPGKGMEVP